MIYILTLAICIFLSPKNACFAPVFISIGEGLGDLSVISGGAAIALKGVHEGLGSLIKKYIPSNGYSSVNNEANKLLNIINSMSSVATGFIPEAIKEEKKM